MKTKAMPLGAVMVDLAGTHLTAEERERLLHPQVAGVVLFSRNFESFAQLKSLCKQIHALRQPKLLIAVDHEGGRVQRFREDGFSPLPAMGKLGRLHALNPVAADEAAKALGWLMAAELLAAGVDFSFAPVVDVDHGRSEVIGERSFAQSPEVAGLLAAHFLRGMHEAGMAGVAKHFPGHGYAMADSHVDVAEDERPWAELEQDLQPFKTLIQAGVEGVMPAHVIYPAVDKMPAGFSSVWLQAILRGQLGFEGAVISDDLNMAAAKAQGNIVQRAQNALDAGCDLVLALNDLKAADTLLQQLHYQVSLLSHGRMIVLHGHARFSVKLLRQQPQWRQAQAYVEQLQ